VSFGHQLVHKNLQLSESEVCQTQDVAGETFQAQQAKSVCSAKATISNN